MTFHVFLLAHSHMYAHINAYRPSLPPSLLSCPAPVSIATHRWCWENEIQRETETEAMAVSMSLYQVRSSFPRLIHFSHRTHLPHAYIYPSATHPSIPPLPRLPQFITPTLIYPSMLYVDSQNHLRAPTNPPFIHSIHQIHQTRSYLIMTFYTPIKCDLSVIHLLPAIHQSIHPHPMSGHQSKSVFSDSPS